MGKKTEQVDKIQALTRATVDELELQLEVIRARREELIEGGFDKDLSAAAAALARAITAVAAEDRAREKARVYNLKTISRAVVVAWLREQSNDERDKLMREVVAMNSNSSVLG